MNAINTAVSGAAAATAWLNTSALNVASVQPTEPLSGSAFVRPVPPVSPAVRVTLSSGAQGGLSALPSQAQPSAYAAYDPAAAYTNARGVAPAPNVDLGTQMIDRTQAMTQFRAAISTIRTADQMQKSLIDIRA